MYIFMQLYKFIAGQTTSRQKGVLISLPAPA
jgi:hypothetical protein